MLRPTSLVVEYYSMCMTLMPTSVDSSPATHGTFIAAEVGTDIVLSNYRMDMELSTSLRCLGDLTRIIRSSWLLVSSNGRGLQRARRERQKETKGAFP